MPSPRRGRPRGSRNAHVTGATCKTISLPAVAWERLAELGKNTHRSAQKVAAGIVIDWLEQNNKADWQPEIPQLNED